MKQTIIRLACLAILTIAMVQPALADDKSTKKEGKAEALFTERIHDFGYIKEENGAVSHQFEFENVGDEPLIIVSAYASCGCTRPEFPTKPIKPGKKGKIKVTFSPIGRPGPFRKEVRVKTNGKYKSYILHIEGSVIPKESKDSKESEK
ncbi:MAG: DUF1573 domain-containing protein [Muribaculaceae bacterium]